ncbi:MAG: hypothetical protein J5I90_16395 [Caldilineales bacterium]|nr:hypothetical protein [Caldilineales bacterium]
MNYSYRSILVAVILSLSSLLLVPASKASAACANNSSTQFRTVGSGDWNMLNVWECSDDGTIWESASVAPTSANGIITVRNGHMIDVAADVTVDQVIIDFGGQVTILSGIVYTIDGSGIDLSINGVLLNQGSLTIVGTNTKWSLGSEGTYIHNTTTSVSTPLDDAILGVNSTFIYRGISSTAPAVSMAGRIYENLIFENTSGPWSKSLSGTNATTINGDFYLDFEVTLNNSSFAGFNLKGDWTNNGTYDAGTGTVTFNGTGAQTISGISATTFNNLVVNSGATVVVPSSATPTAQSVNNSGTVRMSRTVSGPTSFLYIENAAHNLYTYFGINLDGSLGNTTVDVAGNQICPNTNQTGNTSKPVKRCYYITPALSGTVTARFYFLPSELQSGQSVSTLKLWKYGGSGTNWSEPSGLSYTRGACTMASDCYVEVSGLSLGSGANRFALANHNPQAVTIESFDASSAGDSVLLSWQTVSEIDHLGFNLYRAVDDDPNWLRLNPTLIQSPTPGGATGHDYTWRDAAVEPDQRYRYRLDAVDLDGQEMTVATIDISFAAPERIWQSWLPRITAQ